MTDLNKTRKLHPNEKAISDLADEVLRLRPGLSRRQQKAMKFQATKAMMIDALVQMKKSELKRFVEKWRYVLCEILKVRDGADNKHAAGGDAGGLSASQEKDGGATASPHPMNSTR